MAATKTMFMHMLDGGTSMSQNITSAKHSIARIALAKSVISSFTLQRMLASKTVECGVLLANGDEGASCNVCVDLRRPSSTSLKLIQDINEEGSQCANLLGTLGEAREILMETNAGKKFNRVLIMHTDGETALSEGGAGLKELQRELLDDGVLFYLLVFCDQSREDLGLSVGDNIAQFQEFVESVGGAMSVVHDLQGALKFLSSGPGLGSRPMQSKILFEISPGLKMSCVYCTKTTKAPLPSLKKQSNLSYDEDVPDSGKVSTNYMYHNPSDPDEELEFEDRVKGYRYGPQYIPMGGMDENILKLVADPVLRLLGFVPAANIARQHFLTSSFVLGVAAGDANDGTRHAVGALSQALQRRKQAALCRLVKRANADPWLVVLLPSPDGTLLMHRLPCSEDVRNFMFPPLPAMDGVTPVQQQAVVDSMTVSALNPQDLLMVNPASISFLSQLQENAGAITGPLAGIESYDNTFKSLGDHPSSAKIWTEVQSLFGLKPTDQSSRDKKKRKQYWSDFDIVSGSSAGAGLDAAGVEVKREGEEAKDGKLARLESAVPAGLSDGSVNPAEDLALLLSSYQTAHQSSATNLLAIQDIVLSSLRTMEGIIDLLVTTGGTSAHYRKAVTCLQRLRLATLLDFGSSSSAVVDRFNAHMREKIKAKFKGGRHNAFWGSVVAAGVTLVRAEETIGGGSGTNNSGSGVSTDEAGLFLSESVVAVVEEVAEVKEEVEEDDDLFGDMA